MNAGSHALDVGDVASFESGKRDGHFRGGDGRKLVEPVIKGAPPKGIFVGENTT
jgi:hypothetical protein